MSLPTRAVPKEQISHSDWFPSLSLLSHSRALGLGSPVLSSSYQPRFRLRVCLIPVPSLGEGRPTVWLLADEGSKVCTSLDWSVKSVVMSAALCLQTGGVASPF